MNQFNSTGRIIIAVCNITGSGTVCIANDAGFQLQIDKTCFTSCYLFHTFHDIFYAFGTGPV